MDLSPFFKSLVEQDTAPIVICDLSHFVIYMNPAAIEHYSDRGGAHIVGTHIFDCHNPRSNEKILEVFDWFMKDKANNIVRTMHLQRTNKDIYMVALRDDDGELIGYYEKHESRNRDETPLYNY